MHSYRTTSDTNDSDIIPKQLGADITVVSETLVWHRATYPITWLCLL